MQFVIFLSVFPDHGQPIVCAGVSGAGPLMTAGGGRLDGAGKARPLWVPPLPLGRRKNRGSVPGLGRLYFTAIQNYLLKTGGTGKTGGHDF